MAKNLASLALSILSATTVSWVAASCSNSSSSPTNDAGSESSTSGSSGGFSSGSTSGTASGNRSGSASGTSSGTGSGSSGSQDAGDAGGGCRGTASQALIDDQSASTGTAISFPKPACAGSQGTWYDYDDGNGGMISPPKGMFMFSPLPAPLPADAGLPVGEAGASDAASDSGGDGGASGLKAACIGGQTAPKQYSSEGMGFQFALGPSAADGGPGVPVPIDAHMYTGVEFWAWAPNIDAGPQSVTVKLPDKNETAGLGVCDPTNNGTTACGGAESIAQMIMGGWQLIQIPFTGFTPNSGYGGMNETMLDSSSLTGMQFQVQQSMADAGDAGLSFSFCVARISFY